MPTRVLGLTWPDRSYTPGAADPFSVPTLQGDLEAIDAAATWVAADPPTSPEEGDRWAKPGLGTFAYRDGLWRPVGPTYSATAPTSPAPNEGDEWVKTDESPPPKYRYASGAWVSMSPTLRTQEFAPPTTNMNAAGSTAGLLAAAHKYDTPISAGFTAVRPSLDFGPGTWVVDDTIPVLPNQAWRGQHPLTSAILAADSYDGPILGPSLDPEADVSVEVPDPFTTALFRTQLRDLQIRSRLRYRHAVDPADPATHFALVDLRSLYLSDMLSCIAAYGAWDNVQVGGISRKTNDAQGGDFYAWYFRSWYARNANFYSPGSRNLNFFGVDVERAIRYGFHLTNNAGGHPLGATTVRTSTLGGLGWAAGDALQVAGETATTIVGTPLALSDGTYLVTLAAGLAAFRVYGIPVANTTRGNAATLLNATRPRHYNGVNVFGGVFEGNAKDDENEAGTQGGANLLIDGYRAVNLFGVIQTNGRGTVILPGSQYVLALGGTHVQEPLGFADEGLDTVYGPNHGWPLEPTYWFRPLRYFMRGSLLRDPNNTRRNAANWTVGAGSGAILSTTAFASGSTSRQGVLSGRWAPSLSTGFPNGNVYQDVPVNRAAPPVMVALSTDGATWTATQGANNLLNVTTDGTTSTFVDLSAFPTTSYLGVAGNAPFRAIECTLGNSQPNANAASWVAEYWNGSAWTPAVLEVDTTESPAGTTLGQAGRLVLRHVPQDWAANAPDAGMEATTRYWLRLHPTAALDAVTNVTELGIVRGDSLFIDLAYFQTLETAIDARLVIEDGATAGAFPASGTVLYDSGALAMRHGGATAYNSTLYQGVFTPNPRYTSVRVRLTSPSAASLQFDRFDLIRTDALNGGFAGTYASGVAPNWALLAGSTGTAVQETADVRSGVGDAASRSAQKLRRGRGQQVFLQQQFVGQGAPQPQPIPQLDSSRNYYARAAVKVTRGPSRKVQAFTWGTDASGAATRLFDCRPGPVKLWHAPLRVFRPNTGSKLMFGIESGTWMPAAVGFTRDDGATYTERLDATTDGSSATYADLSNLPALSDPGHGFLVVAYFDPFDAITVTLASGAAGANAVPATLAVAARNASDTAWVNVPNLVDGTAIGGASLAQSGQITFDEPAAINWGKSRVAGVCEEPLYWVRLSWDAALDASVRVTELQLDGTVEAIWDDLVFMPLKDDVGSVVFESREIVHSATTETVNVFSPDIDLVLDKLWIEVTERYSADTPTAISVGVYGTASYHASVSLPPYLPVGALVEVTSISHTDLRQGSTLTVFHTAKTGLGKFKLRGRAR